MKWIYIALCLCIAVPKFGNVLGILSSVGIFDDILLIVEDVLLVVGLIYSYK